MHTVSNQHRHLYAARDAKWFASAMTFGTGATVAAAKARATKINPCASGGPARRGTP